MGIRGPMSTAELTTFQSHRAPTKRNPIRKPCAPKHLTQAAKDWWQSIMDAYQIEQHQLRTLLLAAESLDRREQARTALKKHGLTYTDAKGMIRPRPEVLIERDSSTAFLRCVRALKLEAESHDGP